jgi:hypothetical protein
MPARELNHKETSSLMMRLFANISSIRIIESGTFGTLDFTSWEVTGEIVSATNDPKLGLRKGQRGLCRGSSLIWWRWDGRGDWQGGLSLEDEKRGLKGWKIVREHHHLIPLFDPSEGPDQ